MLFKFGLNLFRKTIEPHFMSTCFVMQPFDGDTFDRRFTEVFSPAIQAAGLEPYRVDRDPSVQIPINQIETGIRNADLCLADITLDNPNVWFELGFAIAVPKDVVLVCSKERTTKFPFDVQHRTIISYKTGSPTDFVTLAQTITEKVKAILTKNANIQHLSATVVKGVQGLDQHEMFLLATIAQNTAPMDSVGMRLIFADMDRLGFTRLATTLGIQSLLESGHIENEKISGENFGEDSYFVYRLTQIGWKWLNTNKRKFQLRELSDDVPPEDAAPF